jgi:hypothetical protein
MWMWDCLHEKHSNLFSRHGLSDGVYFRNFGIKSNPGSTKAPHPDDVRLLDKTTGCLWLWLKRFLFLVQGPPWKAKKLSSLLCRPKKKGNFLVFVF